MELVVGVAIGVLALVFLGSLAALVLICRNRCHQDLDQKPILKYLKEQNADVNRSTSEVSDMELDDVVKLSPNIEKVLKDNQWIYDNTGLIEHCLAILRTCHLITDKLSAMSFSSLHRPDQELLDDVRRVTKRIMPRVDDLVRSMYVAACGRKETQAALLEARAAALIMAVNNLALAFRAAYRKHLTPNVDWLNSAFAEMETHLATLRDASQCEEQQHSERIEFFSTNPNIATQEF